MRSFVLMCRSSPKSFVLAQAKSSPFTGSAQRQDNKLCSRQFGPVSNWLAASRDPRQKTELRLGPAPGAMSEVNMRLKMVNGKIKTCPFVPSINSGQTLSPVEGLRESFSTARKDSTLQDCA